MEAEPFPLILHAVEELGLADRPGREGRIERTAMVESAALHLLDLPLMAHVQGLEPSAPAQRLGMVGVAALAGGENRPHGMELTVLAKQVAITENVRLEVPDAHEGQTLRARGRDFIGHQRGSGARIRVHPRTSAGIEAGNRRLSVPEGPPLHTREVAGSKPAAPILGRACKSAHSVDLRPSSEGSPATTEPGSALRSAPRPWPAARLMAAGPRSPGSPARRAVLRSRP